LGWFGSGLFSERNVHFLDVGNKALPGIHLSFWVVVPLAGFICAIAGIIIGWPTLRLRGDYLAIVTLGFGEIIPDVFRNGDDIAGHNLTNGVRGVTQLDRPGFGTTLNGSLQLASERAEALVLHDPLNVPDHDLREPEASRLEDGTGVDRGP
jgi:ABC-type branched-subunit amino acid transport system permease subunit